MSCCASCAGGGPCEGHGHDHVGGARAGGRGFASGAPREVRQVDDALSTLWGAVRDVVPYGSVIDQAHQARRRAMWGEEEPAATPRPAASRRAAPRGAAPAGGDVATIRMLQRTVRAASRGDRTARATLDAWRAAAGSSPAMAARWKLAVAVMHDDGARIRARHRARLGGAS